MEPVYALFISTAGGAFFVVVPAQIPQLFSLNDGRTFERLPSSSKQAPIYTEQ